MDIEFMVSRETLREKEATVPFSEFNHPWYNK